MGEGQRFLEIDFVALKHVETLQLDFVVDFFGLWVCSGQCNWRVCLCGIGWLCSEKQSDRLGGNGLSNPGFVCVVHVFLSCWVEVDMAAQIQQWFHSSTAKMSFLQTATARYCLNCTLLWGNISIERGTLQIHYKVLLGQIWVNSNIHFGSTIISYT